MSAKQAQKPLPDEQPDPAEEQVSDGLTKVAENGYVYWKDSNGNKW